MRILHESKGWKMWYLCMANAALLGMRKILVGAYAFRGSLTIKCSRHKDYIA